MKTSTIFILTASILIFQNIALSQETPKHEKSTYRDSLNRFYVQTSLPLYMSVSTKPNDNKPHELSQSNRDTSYNEIAPMYLDGDGKHTIKHFDEHEKVPVIFTIYADGKAPVSKSSFVDSPKYKKDNTIIYGKNLQVSINTSDDISGIKIVYYSVNNSDYTKYNQPLKLSKEGENTLKFLATDNVGNTAKVTEKKFLIDLTAPTSYYNVTGISKVDSANIISTASIIYLQLNDNISGIANTFYKFDDETELKYNGKSIPHKHLSEGDHTLYFYSIDNVKNKEVVQQFNFFLDKSAPIVATDVLGDRFIVNNQVYFSGRSKLKITAVDNKIGVKDVRFSVNSDEFQKYGEPFYLPSKPGIHVIRYFAIDSLNNTTQGDTDVENREYRHSVSKVYVDLTGPSVFYSYSGLKFNTRDTTFINTNTKIKLQYSDLESGTQKLTYTIDDNPTEIDYSEPITIKTSGFHTISVIGYDNVNNRNFKTFSFVVDGTSPQIYTRFSVEPIGKFETTPIYPPFVSLFVAPTDDLTGIQSILYSINSNPQKKYIGKIEGFIKGEKNIIKLKVTDNLKNINEEQIEFYILKK